jgi:hemoglobin
MSVRLRIRLQIVTTDSELISDKLFPQLRAIVARGRPLLEDKKVKNVRTLGLGLCLMTAVSVSGFAQQKSLFERLGGMPAISAVVDDFANNVLNDTRINKKFAKSDPTRLLANLKDFVCNATGGPCKYTGLSMKESHKNMGTTAGEFNALVEDLIKTLNKFNVGPTEQKELLAALGPLKGDIVEAESAATGTPLPATFKPAPPLGGAPVAAAPAPSKPRTGSLYERIGGMPAISQVVDDFAGNVLADTRINKKFAKTDAPRLLANLKDFVCFATGGPCQYNGLSMKKAHEHMRVTGGEFNALVEDFVKTLDKFNVGDPERGELLKALGGTRPDIVRDKYDTNATGTPVGPDFKPAPPIGVSKGSKAMKRSN